MLSTEKFSSRLMSQFYLVHADINHYAWFKTSDEAHEFLMSKWVDRRIAREVYTPAK
jgi:hypothetical protein